MVDHIGHAIVKIKDYCEEKRISVYELATQLEEKRRELIGREVKLKEGPTENSVALFVSGKESFSKEKACINCSVDVFCACEGANVLFDVGSVLRKELIDVGQGVKMTEPIKVEKGLMTGELISASLSHKGVLAIHGSRCIQLTDLNSNKQVIMRVEDGSLAGFYDEMIILLTCGRHLRETTVEEVFRTPRIETFGVITGTNDVLAFTDVSLLHATRILYYSTLNRELFSFNVDTRISKEINVGRMVWTIASFTGINCEVKAVFKSNDKCTYALNDDDTVTKVNGEQDNTLTAIFPSTSDPKNISNAVSKHNGDIVRDGNKIDTTELIKFETCYSVVRVYGDVFLAYDEKTHSWVLLRIITP